MTPVRRTITLAQPRFSVRRQRSFMRVDKHARQASRTGLSDHGGQQLPLRAIILPGMVNLDLPVYREAYHHFSSMPRKVWSSFWLLERYVNAAISQIDRIRQTLEGSWGYSGTWSLDQITVDVHFYFICWDKAQNMLEHLASIHGDSRLKTLWATFQTVSKPFNDARNHMEHIDERIERDPSFTGHIAGDKFAMAGQTFDVSEAGLKLLTDMYEEVVHIVLTEDPATRSDGHDPWANFPRLPLNRVTLRSSRNDT